MIVETIFSNLVFNGTYFVQAWPHLRREYFEGNAQVLFDLMDKHVQEFNSIPSQTALEVALDKKSLSDVVYEDTKKMIRSMKNAPEDLDWLMKETETYCRDKAMYRALSRAIEIQANAEKPAGERNNKIPDVGAIPDIMAEALAISFDSSVGHDYFEDYEKRWMLYQSKAMKIAFNIPILNAITKGGAERGTLNILMAGVNVGKSLGLCSLAADYLQSGKNVLYISMEMAEHVCSKRIDANLLDVSLDDIDNGNITYADYKNRMERLKQSKVGRLIVKQYPTAGANANHFKALIKELKLKKNFVPGVIIVDYLGICASTRVRGAENTYILVKAIAEELRGLGVEYNVPVFSATQTTRGGYDNTDVDLTDTSESFGLPATVDFMFALISTEELENLNQIMVKQLKNRYNDPSYYKRFVIGVDRARMKLYDVEDSAQKNIADSGQDDGPAFDKSSFGQRMKSAGDGFNF